MHAKEMRFGRDNASRRDVWVRAQLACLSAGVRILDVGAGTQPYRPQCAHLDYVAQDSMAYDGSGDGSGLQLPGFAYGAATLRCDATRIPEPDASFGAILCTEVLEHVPDPAAVVGECARLLAPGGALILTAPFASQSHMAPQHFATGFNRFWYEHHLPRVGIAVEHLEPSGDWYGLLGQELLRLEDMERRCFSRRLGLRLRLARLLAMGGLARRSRAARHAAEVACYGWHVLGRRLARGGGVA
jgi:SAM-dependent methyltransferase